MDHPVLNAIRRESFAPLGWFAPSDSDGVDAKFVVMIGNAGPAMFARFARECDIRSSSLDAWTKATLDPLAKNFDAVVVYPFDSPPRPFLTWARKAGAGHISPLGLNIHRDYGLWHAYRAALLFPVAFDLPAHRPGANPCDACTAKPCLNACPVNAFDGTRYDVEVCGQHILSDQGNACMSQGCKARLACPFGVGYQYAPLQKQFHMKAFQDARRADEL